MDLDDYPSWENIYALRQFTKMTDEEIARESGKTVEFVSHALKNYYPEMMRRALGRRFAAEMVDDTLS